MSASESDDERLVNGGVARNHSETDDEDGLEREEDVEDDGAPKEGTIEFLAEAIADEAAVEDIKKIIDRHNYNLNEPYNDYANDVKTVVLGNAIAYGNLELVQLLLDYGAHPDGLNSDIEAKRSDKEAEDGETASEDSDDGEGERKG